MVLAVLMGWTSLQVNHVASVVAFAAAVVAQLANTDDDPKISGGALLIGAGAVITAVGAQLLPAIKMWFEDRKDRREKDAKAKEYEIRYLEGQQRMARLEEMIAGVMPVARENQRNLAMIVENWNRPLPPPAVVASAAQPTPVPEGPA
jgi:hypothetical protein